MSVSIAGSRLLPAECACVWAALQDVASLRLCVPGCETLARLSPSIYALSVAVPVGPVRVSVSGTVIVTSSEPHRALTLAGQGSKRLLGQAAGTARIEIAEVRSGCCRLRWTIQARPEGPLAALGPIAMTGIASSLTDRFLDRLAALLAVPTLPPTRIDARFSQPAFSRRR